MTAHLDDATSTGAVVRKPPKKETAMRERVRMPQALGYFCLEQLHNFEMPARVLPMGKFSFCSARDFNDLAQLAQFWIERGSQFVAARLTDQDVKWLRGADLPM
jgi:hypothetical protein